MTKKKFLHRNIIPIIVVLAFLISSSFFYLTLRNSRGNARVINYAGVVRGGTQRLVKAEMNGQPNDALITKLDELLIELSTGEGPNELRKLSDPKFLENIDKMQLQWVLLKQEINNTRNGMSSDALFTISEDYFELCNETVGLAETYTESQTNKALMYMICISAAFIAFILFLFQYTKKQKKRTLALESVEIKNHEKSEYLSKMFHEFRAPIDEISELAYISDIETYDLLYVNEAGKKSFQVKEFEGKKCYEVLQGRTSPCPFCTTPHLKVNENYTWEITNSITQRHYLLKDRLIEWEGKTARLEIAFDTTEAENEKVQLKNMLDAEKMLIDCVRVLYENPNIADGIEYVLSKLGSYLESERVYIFEVEETMFYNTFEWCNGQITPQINNLQGIPIEVLERWLTIFKKGDCVIITDIEEIRDTSPDEYEILHEQGITSLVATHLEQSGRISGFIGIDNPPIEKLGNVTAYLQTLRYFIMLAYRRYEGEQKLTQLSYHDALTSFYNRNRYIHDIAELSQYHESIGVVFLDVNGLKEINDHYGHLRGDEVLVKCAKVIQEIFAGYDFYRIGGDEYVILCKQITEQELYEYLRKLKNEFVKDPLCQVAIGSHWVEELKDIDEAIVQADTMMYENKKEYYHEYSASKRYRHHSDEVLELIDESILKDKIANGQFIVYLQPKISSKDDTLVGAEALIRYQPEKGMIKSPGEFVPLLEETQLISYIDFFVLESVCKKMKEWKDKGKKVVPISVNFARSTLAEPNVVERLETIASTNDIDRGNIEIEITENNKNHTILDLQSLINRLRKVGFRISIDDFGTEYANIALLTSFDFDTLKLDKSLVDNIETNVNGRAIVKSIADYCTSINLQLIAEGVEKEKQIEILNTCGIFIIQGYFYSKPIPLCEYEEKYLDKA